MEQFGESVPGPWTDFFDDADYPKHPLGDKLKPPTWDEPGECICGAPLPPQKRWDRAAQDWSNVLCSACGRGFVDEEDFFAIYDPEDVEANGGAQDWRVHTAHRERCDKCGISFELAEIDHHYGMCGGGA